MARMSLETTTDENGYFNGTIPFDPPGPPGASVSLTVTLLSPFATAVWGKLDIDARGGPPSNQQRAFVLWHSETVQLGAWRFDDGAYIIVVTGKTRPARAHARLVLEIEAVV